MELRIRSTDNWDPKFFTQFVELRNRVHRGDPHFLPETLSDLKTFFHPKSPFCQHNAWRAWMLEEVVVGQVRITARLAGTSRKDNKSPSNYVPMGFYESEHATQEGLKSLFDQASHWTQSVGSSEIRLPMQGGFFGGYRARLPSEEVPYFGEPDNLARYLDEWRDAGFEQSGSWQNFELDRKKLYESSSQALQRFYGQNHIPGLTFEPIGKGIDGDLLRLRRHFLDSYRGFPEFTEISEPEFLHLYRPYRHLFRAETCFFTRKDDEDVGFCLAFFDPLPAFRLTEDQFSFFPQPLKNLISILRADHHQKRFFVPYIGKLSKAKNVKGLIPAIMIKLLSHLPDSIPSVSWQYVASTSDTHKSLRPGTYAPKTEFVLFRRALS